MAKVDPSLINPTLRNAVFLIVGVILVIYAIDLFLLLFAGILFATMLTGLSRGLQRYTRLPYRLSLSAVLLGLTIFVALTVWLFVPVVSVQIEGLSRTVPQAIDELQTKMEDYAWLQTLVEEVQVEDWLFERRDFIGQATGFLSTTFGFLANSLFVLFVGIFIAFEPGLYQAGIVKLVPPERRPRIREFCNHLGYTLRWFLFGRLIAMTIVGLLTVFVLWLLETPHAGALALLAGVLTFIPYIGPIVSAIPAGLIGLTISPMHAIYIIVLYTIIQNFEGLVITPVIQRQIVSLPPALLLGTLVFFGLFVGALGLALATPITVAALVAVRMLYIEDVLNDHQPLEFSEAGDSESF